MRYPDSLPRALILLSLVVLIIGPGEDTIANNDEPIVARVGEKTISLTDVDNFAVLFHKSKGTVTITNDSRAVAARQLITFEVLKQKAKVLGIFIDENTINRELRVRAKLWSRDSNDDGKRFGIGEDVLREQYRIQLLRQKMLDALIGEVKVSEEQLQDYYDKHIAMFTQRNGGMVVRYASIAVQDKITKGKRSKAEAALQKTRAVWAEKGYQEPCDCPGQDIPGDTPDGNVDVGILCADIQAGTPVVPDWLVGQVAISGQEFGSILNALKVGEVTPVIETALGYAIFQLGERRPETILPYEQVREDIKYKLMTERRAAAEREALDKLIREAKPEILINFDKK